MESENLHLPARTRRQAMDWSLALASQSLGCTIQRGTTEAGWSLEVAATDFEQAQQIIRQYELENRGWHWRHPTAWPGIAFHGGSTLWCAFLIAVHARATTDARWYESGIMESAAIHAGQWWRLFTALTLHADTGHLISNVTFGWLLLGFAMARYGPGMGLLASYLAGFGGNLVALWLYPLPHQGLGASGMVMGALGIMAVESLQRGLLQTYPARLALGGLLAGFMLFLLLGSNPQSDLIAHLGGFGSGCLLGILLAWALPHTAPRSRLDLLASLLLTILALYTWRRALG